MWHSATGTRIRVARVKAEYPNQLNCTVAGLHRVWGQGTGPHLCKRVPCPGQRRNLLVPESTCRFHTHARGGLTLPLCSWSQIGPSQGSEDIFRFQNQSVGSTHLCGCIGFAFGLMDENGFLPRARRKSVGYMVNLKTRRW